MSREELIESIKLHFSLTEIPQESTDSTETQEEFTAEETTQEEITENTEVVAENFEEEKKEEEEMEDEEEVKEDEVEALAKAIKMLAEKVANIETKLAEDEVKDEEEKENMSAKLSDIKSLIENFAKAPATERVAPKQNFSLKPQSALDRAIEMRKTNLNLK